MNIIVSPDEIQDGAFSRTGRAYKRHLLPRLDDKADIPQDVVFVVVGEPHVPELNAPLDFLRPNRLLRIADQRLFIQQSKDLLRRGHGGLQSGQLLRQILNGLKKSLDVLQENIHSAEGHRSRQHPLAAGGNDDSHGDDRGEHDGGPEHGPQHNLLAEGLIKFLTAVAELLIFSLLPVENLNDLHSREVL